MDKFIEQKAPQKEPTSILLPTERIFSIKLKQLLGCDYKVLKSKDKYAPVDFAILNKQNLKVLHLEYKKRGTDTNKYPSIIVNQSKIVAFKKHYQQSMFCFEYNKEINWINYDIELFNTFNGSRIKNQDVCNIPSHTLKKQYDLMVKNIIKRLA